MSEHLSHTAGVTDATKPQNQWNTHCSLAKRRGVYGKKSTLAHRLPNSKRTHFLDAMVNTRNRLNTEEMKQFVVTLWLIWFSRHKWVNCKENITAESTIKWVAKFLSDLADINHNQIAPTQTDHDQEEGKKLTWTHPPANRYKLNVDAALNKDRNTFSLGAIIRDSAGQILMAAALHREGSSTVAKAEAKAVWEGMRLALDLGFFDLIVESDTANVIKMIDLADKGSLCSGVGLLIFDVSDLTSDCRTLHFSHVPRRLNGPAHQLARCGMDCVWLMKFPLLSICM